MGRSVENAVIPARFLTMMGHLVVTFMVFYTKSDNVKSSLPTVYTTDEFDTADSALTAALYLSLILFLTEIVGLWGGFSLFFKASNAFYTFCHFSAAILTSWFIMEAWRYQSFWYIFGFFHALPAAFEFAALTQVFCCKVSQY
eukprot:TRINITY_DN61570_c0_g2_i2.p1 TRINITY_DN61570_c0_g2~~TRINITY_DN61570_c0_g2_i2.p1  ORF type:complete len:143 (-),score=53.79 TRINITY_DN61570_c0_g2_i2:48-476(-)